jgi:N-methylhydantoinase A
VNTKLLAAVDIGGTFTDIVIIDSRSSGSVRHTAKVPSSPSDPAGAVLGGLQQVLSSIGRTLADLDSVMHATTVATNALLERTGSRVAFCTNTGFEDLLQIGRQRNPDPFDLSRSKLVPLAQSGDVIGVPGRLNAVGEVVDDVAVDAAVDRVRTLVADGVQAVAICLLHAHVNGAHERALRDALAYAVPGLPVIMSHEVAPEAREYERASTSVISAYLFGAVNRYLTELTDRLSSHGGPKAVWVMGSSGGMLPASLAAQQAHALIESGPAAGVIGAAGWATGLDVSDLITFDMGGTTAKGALVVGGKPRLNYDYEVGGPAHAGNFLMKDTGYPLRSPVVDLAEVGTGGGSIVWEDAAGSLRVGPRSAGAEPGPACYGKGGVEPTVTDADAVLGRNSNFRGNSIGTIDVERAREAFRPLAKSRGTTVEDVAEGALALAAAQMADAIRLVTSSRGHDPRSLAMMPFGGAGPVHAWAVARHLGIRRLIVPPVPGVASAVGLLSAPFTVEQAQGVRLGVDFDRDLAAAMDVITELTERAHAVRDRSGRTDASGAAPTTVVSLGMRYVGQSYEVVVDLPDDQVRIDRDELVAAFRSSHEQAYGFAGSGRNAEIVVVRLRMLEALTAPPSANAPAAESVDRPTSPVMFDGTWWDAELVERAAVGDRVVTGPALIQQADTTTVVPPGATCRALDREFLLVDLDTLEDLEKSA